MKKRSIVLILGLSAGILIGGYTLYRGYFSNMRRTRVVFEFLGNPASHQERVIPALIRCNQAPFIMPTTGLIGFLWDDSFRLGHHHQGIDIFSGSEVGQAPVYAAFDGYLTRLSEWKSTVIIRIPVDPLQPDRQIWTYYTHMADSAGNSLIERAFPPGSTEIFVTAGTLLGYQGNYSGSPDRPTGIHLHFSIVKDDGEGKFLNELEIANTLDPSPYLGMALNGKTNKTDVPVCLNP
jgi:murein DD-endopeptidase MepM/ murein hydrolase activator NlpD